MSPESVAIATPPSQPTSYTMAGTTSIESSGGGGGIIQPPSRPLSEISSNGEKRRSTHTPKERPEKTSRPSSEVREPDAKRQSLSVPLQTITVNLVDYASGSRDTATPRLPSSASLTSIGTTGTMGPPPPSPSTKPSHMFPTGKVERPAVLGRPVSSTSIPEAETSKAGAKSEPSQDGVSPLLIAKRASLRPSPLNATYADVAKPLPSPTLSSSSVHSTFHDSPHSPVDLSKPPPPKSKPSWLRRASLNPSLRSKSKSPSQSSEALPETMASGSSSPTLPTSASLPPMLPPRRTVGVTESNVGYLVDQAQRSMPPPKKTTYASVATSNRSRLSDGQGRPAFSPTTSSSSSTPPLSSRENSGFKGRLAAWTSAAQASGASFSRSESSNSIASVQSTSFGGSSAQRIPASAQRVFGHAGSAVQKGWAGLRSRGVGGSISSMSNLAQSSRRGTGSTSGRNMESSNTWGSALSRGGSGSRSASNDSRQSIEKDLGGSDGPIFEDGVCKRKGHGGIGRVFGKELVDVGQTWPVVDATELGDDVDDMEKRRKRCLPAIVVRAVDYLEIWGPKEEGIFRISGRSSHIARLRKEFDAGADLDLSLCHPGDLDPHAVSSLFKSYLRELPAPLLTTALVPKFDAYARSKRPHNNAQARSSVDRAGQQDIEDLPTLLQQLPVANWFLLADIVKLLDLIPKFSSVNRMSLSNLMLVLGPTLNISGHVLNLLLEQRTVLFANPPPVSGIDTAKSLIDFGDIDISPRTPTPDGVSVNSSLVDGISVGSGSLKRSPPKLLKKPSLSRLLTASSSFVTATLASAGTSSGGVDSPKRNHKLSTESLSSSIVNVTPPRVELDVNQLISPLPTFSDLNDTTADKSTKASSSKDAVEDARYAKGTVEERTRLFTAMTGATPIADKFQGTGAPMQPLRVPKHSPPPSLHGGSGTNSLVQTRLHELGQPSPNNVAGFRRGPNVFFQSASLEKDRRSRSSTATSVGSLRLKKSEETPRDELEKEEVVDVTEDIVDDNEDRPSSAGPSG